MTDTMTEGLRITRRLVIDLRTAHASWAQFVALDRSYNNTANGFKSALQELGLSEQLIAQADAFIRDALMAMFRMTDNAGNDKDCLTLCHLSGLLADEDFQLRAGEGTRHNIDLIRSFIPSKWDNSPPAQDEIFRFRTNLRPVRDGYIAHALETRPVKFSWASVEDCLRTIEKLVHAAKRIFRLTVQTPIDLETCIQHASDYWQRALMGFISQPKNLSSSDEVTPFTHLLSIRSST